MQETILFYVYSKGWERDMPVTLVEYDNGGIDLVIQTGDHHSIALEMAKPVLEKLGMRIVSKDSTFIGPDGAYYDVEMVGQNEKHP